MFTRIATSACALCLMTGPALAAEFFFTADISGLNEVPANGSPATGLLTGTYDDVANEFSFDWSITDNLLGDPTAAHIHNAPAGVNGGVVFPFSPGAFPLVGSDTWSGLSAGQVSELFAGNMYANFHTTAFPGGEIRGQIELIPAPGAAGLLALAGFGVARRRRG